MRRRGAKVVALARARPETRQPPRLVPSAGGSLSLQVEPLIGFANELVPLLVRHHAEIEPDGFPLEPDWDEWYRSNALGVLRILTVRDDGSLVGYVFNIVRPSLHHKSILHCFVEGFWLDPVHRAGWAPIAIFRENDRLLAEWGVRRTYMTAELVYRDGRARSIFRRLGYKLSSEVWSKVTP